VTLGGGSARRRPLGHVPVRLPRCCLPPHQESEVSRWRTGVILARSPRASSLVLHGRGRFFVSPGEEVVHVRKGQVGRTPATPAMERQGFFPRREGRRGPRALRWARTPPATTWAKEWCCYTSSPLVTTPTTTPATILKTMRQVLKPSRTICPCTFTSSLVNFHLL
jgi:hypothetical protein